MMGDIMRHRSHIMNDWVDAKTMIDREKLQLEVLLDIRDGINKLVIDAEGGKW